MSASSTRPGPGEDLAREPARPRSAVSDQAVDAHEAVKGAVRGGGAGLCRQDRGPRLGRTQASAGRGSPIRSRRRGRGPPRSARPPRDRTRSAGCARGRPIFFACGRSSTVSRNAAVGGSPPDGGGGTVAPRACIRLLRVATVAIRTRPYRPLFRRRRATRPAHRTGFVRRRSGSRERSGRGGTGLTSICASGI